jgi:hypothetical protein
MEAMRQELAGEGYAVTVVAINIVDAESSIQQLVIRSSYDVLQDERSIAAWRLLGGDKDDIFIYREGGSLAPGGYLAAGGPLNTNLSTAAGYANVRDAIIRAGDLGRGAVCIDGVPAGGLQLPGDMSQDGRLDLSDAFGILGRLFLGSTASLPCGEGSIAAPGNRDILDVNRDGSVNISDAVHILNYLFAGGPPPAAGTECVAVEGCASACSG